MLLSSRHLQLLLYQSVSHALALNEPALHTQTDYILGPGDEQMSEYAMQPGNPMAWVHTNVWVAGRLLATYAQDSNSAMQKGLLHFYFNDTLGSQHAQADYAGNLERNCGNLPYGDRETGDPTPPEQLFVTRKKT
jgi:hypothetical protein